MIETESTYGTDAVPTAADAVQVSDLNIVPLQSDLVSRDLIRPYLGSSRQLLANTRVECSFSVELAGSGTAGTAPRYSKALEACGLSETIDSGTSVTYAPKSSSFESITIYYNLDGVLHRVLGCRGTCSLNASVGEIPKINFTFVGIYTTPTATAAPTPTYGDQADPLVFKHSNTTGFALDSYSGKLQTFGFDLGVTTAYRELIGGGQEILITNRAAAGSVTIEAPPVGTKNYFTAALTDTSFGNLTFTHGSAAGNTVEFESTRIDISEVAYGEADGIAMLDIGYTAVPSTSGNDEFELTYT